MRHGNKVKKIGRTHSHRKAMLGNMAASLIKSDNKRIITTLAKAKALRMYIEPLVTKSKDNTTHSRRTVFGYLQDKEAVSTLFNEVARKIGERAGGYTRILKLGPRQGDNAEMALIEFVDFNEFLQDEGSRKKSRRRKKKKTETTPKVEAKQEVVEEAAEEVVEEAENKVEETPVEPEVAEAEEQAEEKEEAAEPEAKAEEPAAEPEAEEPVAEPEAKAEEPVAEEPAAEEKAEEEE